LPLTLCRYFDAKFKYVDLMVPMMPPGHCMLVRRLKEAARHHHQPPPPPPPEGQQGQGLARRRWWGGKRPAPPASSWNAVWIQPEQIMDEGILISR
jgi:hypothetical protein